MTVPSYYPWPFDRGSTTFRYSVNVSRARELAHTAVGSWGRWVVEVEDDDQYVAACRAREHILAEDPRRLQMMDHMRPGCWDLVMFYLRELADARPDVMSLRADGDHHVWSNALLGQEIRFRYGDDDTVPNGPLGFVGSQVPEDLLLLSERDGQLWFDAGVVTFAGNWSIDFDLGMSFHQIHSPVPRFTGEGHTNAAEQFMRRLTPDDIYRRTNWTFSSTGTPRLDTSLESMPTWGWEMPALMAAGEWGRIQLRVETEHFIRLPSSGALVFSIRTTMLSLADIATVPEWAEQMVSIVTELPDDMAEYKGMTDYREPAMAWLAEAAGLSAVTERSA
ncbi:MULTISPECIES: heme-dependent oxidative N-demethylase family protein [unclassified Gordonia (in: high G+C Gram-positive bacteria)]